MLTCGKGCVIANFKCHRLFCPSGGLFFAVAIAIAGGGHGGGLSACDAAFLPKRAYYLGAHVIPGVLHMFGSCFGI